MKLSPEQIEEMGLNVLGHCHGSFQDEEGKTVYPADFGQYDVNCEGCQAWHSLCNAAAERRCGTCCCWIPSGDYE